MRTNNRGITLAWDRMELETADGYADLGLWQEAWETLDQMSASEKEHPAAFRLRLRCCGPLGSWSIGEHLANILRDGDHLDRQSAAHFFLAYALAHPDQGGSSIAAAVETWPPCEQIITADPRLAKIAATR